MQGELLLVEDDERCARTVARLVAALAVVTVAASVEAAHALVAARDWLGLIVDVGLPDGDGLDVLARARVAGFAGAALVLTGLAVVEVANRAVGLGAELAIKPIGAERIVGWTRRAVAREDDWLEVELGAWQRIHALSEAELHVLELAVRMRAREEIAIERHVSIETVKSHVASLLRKTGDASLKDAAMRVLWGMVRRSPRH